MKLYATSVQFPAILYQVLQEVETEGFCCREVYVDTFKVNFSAAAEEVAAMFRVRIVPVSSGTPQENAYAESAVRTVAAMSRIQMAGAPHRWELLGTVRRVMRVNRRDSAPKRTRQEKSL